VRLELVEADSERHGERQRFAVCELRVHDRIIELLPDGSLGALPQVPWERRRLSER